MPSLSHMVVGPEGGAPRKLALVLHGILGMGQNFRTLARRWANDCPGWGFVLPDLRGHGASQGFDPPHDIDAVCADLEALAATFDTAVRAVIGHSFGGKTSLALAARGRIELERCIVLDASPSTRMAQGERLSAHSVLSTLESLPPVFATREAFADSLRAVGYPRAIVDWLAMNLRRENDELRLRLDLVAIRSLLSDYFLLDLWKAVEGGQGAQRFVLVAAQRSETLDAEDRKRAQDLAARCSFVDYVEVPNVGHWLHAEDPDAVTRIVTEQLALL